MAESIERLTLGLGFDSQHLHWEFLFLGKIIYLLSYPGGGGKVSSDRLMSCPGVSESLSVKCHGNGDCSGLILWALWPKKDKLLH